MGDMSQDRDQTTTGIVQSEACVDIGASWASSVPSLATSRSANDAGSPAHELYPGTNGLTFNGLPVGKVYARKYKNTGVWVEEWFVENANVLLDFQETDFLQISWEGGNTKSSAYTPITSNTHKAVVDYVYLNLPTQADVDQLAPPTTTQTSIQLNINGRVTGASPAVATGSMFRVKDTAGGKTVITEHWVLFANYEPPTNNYDRIELSRVNPLSAYADLPIFMLKMIDQQGTEKGWLYVQVSYTVDSVLP